VYDFSPFLGSDYTAVHAHFGPNGAYVARLKALGLFSQSRFITSFHGYDLELSVAKGNAYQDLFDAGDIFTVNSSFSKQKLLRLGCPPDKIRILPVGLDTAYFNRNLVVPTGNRPFTILFVGRLIRVKGPDLVIEICRLLKHQHALDFRAVLVGEGEERNALMAAIGKAGIQDIVKLAGAKTQAEVRQLMAEADVFLLPGRTITGLAETQGLVIQEAQAMGLPVIVSDAGGMQEGLISGETGFVLREGDVAAFACKIEDLAKDSACRERMGKVGRK
jgi:colanic acid/amylovoran biosynthesis glycosyltransferase